MDNMPVYDRDAARERIRQELLADGWDVPADDAEFRKTAFAHFLDSLSPDSPDITDEEAMQLAVEETHAARRARRSPRSA